MSRPVIGVTTARGRGWPLWAFAALSLRLRRAIPRRITAPFDAAAFDGLDGLVIGGGDDIGATLYGAEPAPDVRLDPERDALELGALERLWHSDIPILGICRGSQMMNVFLGGSLHQDIYNVYRTAPRMRTPLPLKRVEVADGTRLGEIVRDPRIVVNALHSQSVDRLGSGLRIAAKDEHGIVQATEFPGARFRIGVQWHPEFLFYKSAHWRLWGAFVKAARAASGRHERAARYAAVADRPDCLTQPSE